MAEELPCFSSSLCCLFFKILASLAFLAASRTALIQFRCIYKYICNSSLQNTHMELKAKHEKEGV